MKNFTTPNKNRITSSQWSKLRKNLHRLNVCMYDICIFLVFFITSKRVRRGIYTYKYAVLILCFKGYTNFSMIHFVSAPTSDTKIKMLTYLYIHIYIYICKLMCIQVRISIHLVHSSFHATTFINFPKRKSVRRT